MALLECHFNEPFAVRNCVYMIWFRHQHIFSTVCNMAYFKVYKADPINYT